MDNDGSPRSKRSSKDTPKNPPPSQFHQQEPLQPKPPRGPKITYTSSSPPKIINVHPDDFKPVVQHLTGLSSTSATSSSLFTSSPKDSSEQFDASRGLISPAERAKTLNELGFMGGVQTSIDQSYLQNPQNQVSMNQSYHQNPQNQVSMDQSFYHHQNRGRPSFFQDGNLSSSGAISQSLMLSDLSLTLGPSNSQGSSSFADFNPLLQRHTGKISTSSTQSSSSSSTLAPKETSDLVHVSRGLMIPHQSSAFRRYHPQTLAATSSSLSRGLMIPHQSSAFRRYHSQTSAATSSAPKATSEVFDPSRALMIPPAARSATPMRPRTSNELGFMGSVTTLDQSSRQLQENIAEFYRQLSNMVQGHLLQNQRTINYEEVVQNLGQSSRQLPQNQPTVDQDYHQLHQNRGIKRSRSNFGDDLSLGGIFQSSMSPGSSSMVKPSDPPQGSPSSSSSNSNPKD